MFNFSVPRNLIFTAFFLNSLINSAYADFKPKESPPPKSAAQGTRGCPVRLGELALFGSTESERQLQLDLNMNHPLILYQVNSAQAEKVLVTITQVNGKFERTLIYQQQVAIVDGNYKVLKLPNLKKDKTYLLSLVLLCENRPQYGKTIHAWLNMINTETQVNTFIQSRNLFDEKAL